jgi:hypothetical protein
MTGTTCPDPDPVTGTTTLTWDNFGHDFMFKYCVNCHSSQLTTPSERHGASPYHDFDTLSGVVMPWRHIDEQAGGGPRAINTFMPGAGTDGRCPSQLGGPLDEDCPQPTDEERRELAQWGVCEACRAHNPQCLQ